MKVLHQRHGRREILASLALPLAASMALNGSVRAAQPSAVVAGTNELEIRSCPTPRCQVGSRAPRGAAVEILQEADETMVEVAYQDATGFANRYYLISDPAHPPYLVAGEPGCARVAWIFNVGVGAEPATGILDTLAAEGVPATMFVMGWWASQHPAILERMVAEGYIIGSHGDQANEFTGISDAAIVEDLRNAAAGIEHAIGRPPDPYFTPYAAATDERVRAIVAAEGYLNVGWEVPAADYGADATADGVYARVMDNIYDGAIVELHLDGPASAESTGTALPWMIRDLRAQGYTFVTIPEMAQPCS